MNISAPFVRRPVATTLLTLAITIAGILAFLQLPVASLPQVDLATITVATTLPGASPEIMASSVSTPLERQFAHIAGITQMTSTSTLGTSGITLQFDLSRDVDGAARDVEAAINAARSYLPSNLPSNPTYRKVNPASMPLLVLSLTSDTHDQGELYDTASSVVSQKLAQVEGVGQVQVVGSSLPAVRISLNPQQISSYGLGIQDVARVITGQNSNRPKGQLSDDFTTANITANDQISKAADYAPLIVGNKNGAVIHLSDVATITDSVQNIRMAGYANGKPSVTLLVYRLPDANVIDTADRVKAIFPSVRASISPSDHLGIVADTTTTIRASVKDVEGTLLLSIALVIGVVFLFLRNARATFIPGVAVTVSIIGTFAVIYLLKFSLNNLSLMALTISTGFVVDDAIVVMENITRYVELGMAPPEAALRGAKEIGFTVLSMSLSLVAVFIPILFMGGLVGRLFREFAVTLAVSIGVSMIVSMMATPMMCAYLLKPVSTKRQGLFPQWSERFFAALLEGYRSSLKWTLQHSYIVLGIFFLTFLCNGFLAVRVPKGFFPQQDTGLLMGNIQGSQDASFVSMRNAVLEVQKIINADPAVASAVGFTGGGGGAASNTGIFFVSLKPLAERKISATQVLERLRPKLNAISGASTYLQALQDLTVGGRQSNAAYQYQLSADSVSDLGVWGQRLYEEMRKMPELRDVNTDQQNKGLQVLLDYDRVTSARMGITPKLINQSLYLQYGEAQIATIYSPLNQYHVVMEVPEQFRRTPETLDSVFVRPEDGKPVPLDAFVKTKISTSPLAVNHSGIFPSVTISFNLASGVSLGDATKSIEQMQQRIGTPPTVRSAFAGTADAFQKSLASEPMLILTAILVIYIVLGILYESLLHPITILTTLPSASVGALAALLFFKSELDVISLIGLFLLIGIVKKNAIMMIDFALQAEREQGKNSADAIFEACMLRFRPILMTTFAALFGAFPLAFGHGTGSELRKPMGIAIVGGLIVSQILTLYTTPVIYLHFDKIRRRFSSRSASTVSQLSSEAPS